MDNPISRRQLLKVGAAASLATVVAGVVPGMTVLAQSETATAPATGTATEERNKMLFSEAMEKIFNGKQLDLVDTYYSENYIQHNPLAAPGRDGVKSYFGALFNAFPDWTGKIEHLFADGDYVIAFIRWGGTQEGEYFGIPATNKPTSYMTADIALFVDEKIVEHWDVVDTYTFLSGLGVVPPMGGESPATPAK